jgi:hypothetical protein
MEPNRVFHKAFRLLDIVRSGFPSTPLGRLFWAASASFALYVAWFDPLAINTRAETTAEAVAQHIVAGHYDPAASHRIAVLETFPEGFMADTAALSQPLSLQELASLVSVLASAKVQAIYLDSRFEATPNSDAAVHGIAALSNAVRHARENGILVYSGPVRRTSALAALVGPTGLIETSVTLTGEHPADYNLRGPPQEMAAAATALYIGWCGVSSNRPSCDADLLRHLTDLRHRNPDLAIRFGVGEGSSELPASQCRTRTLAQAALDSGEGVEAQEPCSHHLLIPVHRIFESSIKEISTTLGGRIVLIGAGPSLGDDHLIPGVGNIPGVAIHAMALDNLLTWGSRYPHWPADFSKHGRIGWDELLQLAIVILTPIGLSAFAKHLHHRFRIEDKATAPADRRKAAFQALLAVCGTLAGLAICALAGCYWAGWPVGCVLLTLTLAGLIISIMAGEEFAAVLGALNTPGSALVSGTALIIFALFLGCYWLAVILFIATIVACLPERFRFWRLQAHPAPATGIVPPQKNLRIMEPKP